MVYFYVEPTIISTTPDGDTLKNPLHGVKLRMNMGRTDLFLDIGSDMARMIAKNLKAFADKIDEVGEKDEVR